jgi:hypothetical protein
MSPTQGKQRRGRRQWNDVLDIVFHALFRGRPGNPDSGRTAES